MSFNEKELNEDQNTIQLIKQLLNKDNSEIASNDILDLTEVIINSDVSSQDIEKDDVIQGSRFKIDNSVNNKPSSISSAIEVEKITKEVIRLEVKSWLNENLSGIVREEVEKAIKNIIK